MYFAHCPLSKLNMLPTKKKGTTINTNKQFRPNFVQNSSLETPLERLQNRQYHSAVQKMVKI